MAQTLEINVSIQIQKTPSEVFDAIVDPVKMCGYFLSKSSGPLESGKTVVWNFPEFSVDVPVRVEKVVPNEYVSYYWSHGDKELLVEMKLQEKDNHSTLLTVSEKSMEQDEAGMKWLVQNTQGWTFFLSFIKAYLEYGINLRKGAFDFMRQEQLP